MTVGTGPVHSASILVVDDEPAMLRYLRTLLELESHQVETASTGNEAIERLQRSPLPDLVLLDLLMPDLNGLEVLKRAREMHPHLNVVMLSCVNDSRKVVEAVRLGALDYVTKPFQKSEIEAVLQDCLAPGRAKPEPADGPDVIQITDDITFVCASPPMRRIRRHADMVASIDLPVLLLGESGTGKEVLAHYIHTVSPRAKQTFLKVNCAAVPSELLESELFGYEAGAFTGATKAKPGKFELCHGGTIFLDEVGEMPPPLQAKLLHVLQDYTFSRLGSRTTVKADVRILAATNISIEQAIADKKLREDLYYRLNGFSLRMPPLRERKKEIPLLLKHFMGRFAERYSRPPVPFSSRLMQACLAYNWPGNLRQLENFVKRYLVLADEELALVEFNGERAGPVLSPSTGATEQSGLKGLARAVKGEAEAQAIAHALAQTNWHRHKAAALLKISYKALLYKIREYDLQPPSQ